MRRGISLFIATLAAASALNVKPVPTHSAALHVKPAAVDKALALRGGGVIPQDLYLKMVAVPFSMYGLQFLLTPEMCIDLHFDYTPDENHIFLARGSGVAILALVYALFQMPLDAAVKLSAIYSLAVGIVYPWSAAYLLKLPVKYPMHYVPEVLMAVLSLCGALAL